MQYNIKMKNPVKKYMDRLWKPKTHYDPSKYDRVKEKCSHWDLDWHGMSIFKEKINPLIKQKQSIQMEIILSEWV